MCFLAYTPIFAIIDAKAINKRLRLPGRQPPPVVLLSSSVANQAMPSSISHFSSRTLARVTNLEKSNLSCSLKSLHRPFKYSDDAN